MATLDDIAKKANVSKSAVSLALNNKEGLSEETRKNILKIANELGYQHRTRTVNIDSNNISNLRFLACIKSEIVSIRYQVAPFFMELIHGLEKKCHELGYSLTFSSVQVDSMQEEVYNLERNHPSRGIILLGTNLTPSEIKIVYDIQPNLVVVDTQFDYLNYNFVVMNNMMGAYQAASYLVDLGHKKIGYIQSARRIKNFQYRKLNFTNTLKESDITINKNHIFKVTPNNINVAEKEFLEILKNTKDLPTALFCENDYIAIGVIKALQNMGIIVPDDISVIGFDDIDNATIISPKLTTIRVEKEKMGEIAIKRLVDVVDKKEPLNTNITIATRLVERESCLNLFN